MGVGAPACVETFYITLASRRFASPSVRILDLGSLLTFLGPGISRIHLIVFMI